MFFATDVLAIGGLLAAAQRGIAVPGTLAIAGLGDLEIGRELMPGLTTVRVPAYDIGREAGEAVVRRLAGDDSGGRVRDLGLSIIGRGST